MWKLIAANSKLSKVSEGSSGEKEEKLHLGLTLRVPPVVVVEVMVMMMGMVVGGPNTPTCLFPFLHISHSKYSQIITILSNLPNIHSILNCLKYPQNTNFPLCFISSFPSSQKKTIITIMIITTIHLGSTLRAMAVAPKVFPPTTRLPDSRPSNGTNPDFLHI